MNKQLQLHLVQWSNSDLYIDSSIEAIQLSNTFDNKNQKFQHYAGFFGIHGGFLSILRGSLRHHIHLITQFCYLVWFSRGSHSLERIHVWICTVRRLWRDIDGFGPKKDSWIQPNFGTEYLGILWNACYGWFWRIIDAFRICLVCFRSSSVL